MMFFFNTGVDLFPELILPISIPRLGYFGGFLTSFREGIENFSIFYPDEPTEYWIEEAEFTSFNEWLIGLIEQWK